MMKEFKGKATSKGSINVSFKWVFKILESTKYLQLHLLAHFQYDDDSKETKEGKTTMCYEGALIYRSYDSDSGLYFVRIIALDELVIWFEDFEICNNFYDELNKIIGTGF